MEVKFREIDSHGFCVLWQIGKILYPRNLSYSTVRENKSKLDYMEGFLSTDLILKRTILLFNILNYEYVHIILIHDS